MRNLLSIIALFSLTTAINAQSLKEDALNDMVAPYAESGLIDEAEKYFKNIVKEPKYFIETLKRLAQIYFDQKRWKEAITIYEKILWN